MTNANVETASTKEDSGRNLVEQVVAIEIANKKVPRVTEKGTRSFQKRLNRLRDKNISFLTDFFLYLIIEVFNFCILRLNVK